MISPKLSIRRATTGDASFIQKLSSDAFGEYSTRAGSTTIAMLSRSRALTLVAEVCQQRVGFASLAFEGASSHLLAIAVVHAERGKGIGKRLLEQAVLRAEQRGAELLELVTAESNLEGLHLFLRSGFEIVERRPHYYARGQTGLWLRRDLASGRP